MKTLTRTKIEVKQADIKKGTCGNAQRCAVARAVHRRFKSAKLVSVGSATSIHVHREGGDAERWYGPLKVDTFINKFDNNKNVEPFSFILKRYKEGE